MTPADQRLERLLQGYLDGALSPAETTELSELLVRDPAAADAFARAVRFEDLLQTHLVEERRAREWTLPAAAEHADEKHAGTQPEPVERPALRRRWPTAVAVLAAAAALLIAVRWWGGEPQARAVVHQVVAGRVLVDGIEARSFIDGSRLEVLGSSSAAIRLADGNDFELTPATSAIVRREGGESIVRLDYGNGKFRGTSAKRPLRVDTPLGAVSGRAADFAVDLQPVENLGSTVGEADSADPDDKEPMTLDASLPAFLIVAVLAGQVEVQEADQKVKVSAGESRAFAQEKVPAFAGTIVEVSADGKRITIEGKRSKPDAPLPRHDVSITAATKMTYYGTAVGDDRPKIETFALAVLDKNSPDTAVSIEFGEKSPTLSGTVRDVSPDGRTLKIEQYRKGEAPLERTITLDARTRTSFYGFDSTDVQATVGYQAWIWLTGDSDRVAEVRFLYKFKGAGPKSTGDGGKNPPTKKPPASDKTAPVDKSQPADKTKPMDKSPPVDKSKLAPNPDGKSTKPDLKKDAKPAPKSDANPKDRKSAAKGDEKKAAFRSDKSKA